MQGKKIGQVHVVPC